MNGLSRSFRQGPAPPVAPAPRTPSSEAQGFPLARKLDGSTGFDAIYSIVRAAVRSVLGIERPGLGLALSDLPPQLGAYWQVTGNLIVLNEGLVETMRHHARSPAEENAFVFVLLAHEYLHALGYLDEAAVRRVTARVARDALGPDHPATRMAEGDLWQQYPFLAHAPEGRGRHFKVVRGFDLDSTANYIR